MPIKKRKSIPKPKVASKVDQRFEVPGPALEGLLKEQNRLASDAAWANDSVQAAIHEDAAEALRERIQDGELYEVDFLMSVLILEDDLGQLYVCEEYDEADDGRMHLLGENQYANFNRQTMSLDRSKVSSTITVIHYEAPTWPKGTVRSRNSILASLAPL